MTDDLNGAVMVAARDQRANVSRTEIYDAYDLASTSHYRSPFLFRRAQFGTGRAHRHHRQLRFVLRAPQAGTTPR
jgi:hypothetical protein